MNLIDLITKNTEKINSKLKNFDKKKDKDLKFNLDLNKNENLEFTFVGSGTFGNVLKVKNNTNDSSIISKGDYLVVKIMKEKNDEPERCRKILNKINNIKKSSYKFKNQKLDLIKKYITEIIDIKKHKDIDLIFMEFIDGDNLKEYLSKNKLDENKLNTLILKILISVRVFNKLLGLSHRDLKLENLHFNEKNNTIKIIDFGFTCEKDDLDCINRYQGTGKYINPLMNKKYHIKKTQKNNINNLLNLNHSSVSNNSSIRSKKNKKMNFPNATAQDLFSLLIIILKLYYYFCKKNNKEDNKVFNIVNKYNKSFDNDSDGTFKNKKRYKVKKELVNGLLKCNKEDFDSDLVYLVKKLFENYWDNRKYKFKIGIQESEATSKFIYDSLIFSSLLCNKKNTDSESLVNEFRNLIRLI